MSTAALLWFRRDLRIADNPALLRARDCADEVVPVFVFDPALWEPAGPSRRAYLLASLASLRDSIGGLVVRVGDPADVLPALARETGASSVHAAADYGPYGSQRDARVESALESAGVSLVRTGSPYAVAPGRVLNQHDGGYQVFTPFSRAWRQHGWRQPPAAPESVPWATSVASDPWPRWTCRPA